ncbi:MAG: arginase family protein [Verrucomicrobia bacterium]|nr:arginase family protein [Verrucomicrobiota bacterium]MBV8280217.1 arginase family protein [Verrucomicrobiota bacterium]
MDPIIKVRNAVKIRDYSRELAHRIKQLLEQGRFPIVLGGDCSVLLGIGLGLHQHGRHGLLFMVFRTTRRPRVFVGFPPAVS